MDSPEEGELVHHADDAAAGGLRERALAHTADLPVDEPRVQTMSIEDPAQLLREPLGELTGRSQGNEDRQEGGLDLARDPSRGREILDQWHPDTRRSPVSGEPTSTTSPSTSNLAPRRWS